MLCGGRNEHYTAKEEGEPALDLLLLWLLDLLGFLLSCKISVLVIKFGLSSP